MVQFNSTTINSATPGKAVMDWLDPILTTQGWTFVETTRPPLGTSAIQGSTTGAVSSATATALTRSGGVSWSGSALIGYHVQITGGTGASSTPVVITANSTSVLTVAAWPNDTPDNTSTYAIVGTSNIYKSPAANNSIGHDFYLALHRISDVSGSAYPLIFEEWDSGTKKARKYAPYFGTGITVNPADNTVTDATGLYPSLSTVQGGSIMPNASILIPLNTPRTLYVDITVNRIVWGQVGTGAPADSGYVGVFQSLLPAALDPVPLVSWRPDKGTNNLGGSATTREPTAPAASATNFQIANAGTSATAREYAFIPTNSPAVGLVSPDLYQGYVAARITIGSGRGNTIPRGVLDGPVTAFSGGSQGDTLTVTMPDASVRHYVLTTVTSTTTVHFFVRTS